jgi:hypothetical protein
MTRIFYANMPLGRQSIVTKHSHTQKRGVSWFAVVPCPRPPLAGWMPFLVHLDRKPSDIGPKVHITHRVLLRKRGRRRSCVAQPLASDIREGCRRGVGSLWPRPYKPRSPGERPPSGASEIYIYIYIYTCTLMSITEHKGIQLMPASLY